MTVKKYSSNRPVAKFLLTGAFVFTLVNQGCEKPPAAGPPPERPPLPVTVTLAIAQDVPVYLDEIGRCVARESVTIIPQVSGKITERPFKDGDPIKVGDPLFTIDPRPYQAQVAQAEAAVTQWQAAADLAKTDFARMESLVNTKAISRSDYDTKKGALAVAEAQVQSAKAALETAKLNLEYCSIRSPIEGLAGQRLVDAGNVVMAGAGSPLLVIQRLDPIYADFTVTENDLSAVQQNRKNGTLKVEVALPDDPAHPVTGDLTFLDNAVYEASGTVKLRATIANADHKFWPGRFVKVRLILSTIKDAVLIPVGAPQISAKGQFVFVVTPQSTAEMRVITTGQRQGDLLVVKDGVKAGDRVITLGQFVMPGGKVRVEEPPKADAPPTAKPGDAASTKPGDAPTAKPGDKTAAPAPVPAPAPASKESGDARSKP